MLIRAYESESGTERIEVHQDDTLTFHVRQITNNQTVQIRSGIKILADAVRHAGVLANVLGAFDSIRLREIDLTR